MKYIVGGFFHYYIHLIPENLNYYEVYKYSPVKMKSGDIYSIKPLYLIFGVDYIESLKYSSNLIEELSVKLHNLRNSHEVGFSYDGYTIDIRILPK